MPEAAFIYGLTDPRTDKIRYIGKANDVQKRFRSHLQSNSLKRQTHKDSWLVSLFNKNLTPRFVIIAKVDLDKSASMEQIAIKKAKTLGWNLTNLTEGGDGVIGYQRTEANKEKVRQFHIGRKDSIETKEKKSIARKKWLIGKILAPHQLTECKNCHNNFEVLVSLTKAGRGQYCSKKCQTVAMANRRWHPEKERIK